MPGRQSPIPSIRRPSDFRQVYRAGRVVRRRCIELRFLRQPESVLQLGVTIPKKVGTAVARNRLRRRIREYARRYPHEVMGGEVVVHCRPGAAELSGEELRRELRELWRSLRGLTT